MPEARSEADTSPKERTRARILEAARIVFAREGFVEATLTQVAVEAGLGKSSLYRHVDSKAELFVEALLSTTRDVKPLIDAVLAEETSAEAQLRRLADAQLAFMRDNPSFRQVIWAIDNQDLIGDIPRELIERAREQWVVHLSVLERVIANGIESGEFRECDPRLTAHVIWNIGNLAFELRFSHERKRLLEVPVDRFYADALELALAGLKPAG